MPETVSASPVPGDALLAQGKTRLRAEEIAGWNAFQLLQSFCAASGFGPLEARRERADNLPEPYRGLLVHSRDMTSTLESYYGETTRLRVLRRDQTPITYSREVLLATTRHGAVEYGLIRIHLDCFSRPVRERILEEQLPLGRLLLDHEIAHLCWPQGFFRIEPHPYVQSAMGLPRPAVCYGRRNVILSGERRLLADVLEILPPCLPAASGRGSARNSKEIPNG